MLSWLRVDKAITFFTSDSKIEFMLAIIRVIMAIISTTRVNLEFLILGSNRIIKYTPAVTKVEE